MKRNWAIIGLTTLAALIVAFLIVHLYSSSRRAVLSRFQEHQVLHAHHFADEIESFFRGHSRVLLALSLSVPPQGNGLGWMKTQIESYSREVRKDYTKEILLYDATGKVVFSTNRDAVGSNSGQNASFAWAKKGAKRGEVSISSLSPDGSDSLYQLSIPLYQTSTGLKDSHEGQKLAGVLAAKVDLKEFLFDELKESKINLAQIWIMDKAGNLLFHSEHPEMMLRNIHQRDESCKECHLSFDYAEKILKEGQGAVDYELKNMPKKLAAFSTAEIANESWTVVVNFPYGRVATFATKSLREHLILLGIVVLAFAASSTLILRNKRLKETAEEKARRWQERMAERKKAEEAIDLERKKLKSILDNMQDGVSIVDQECDIQYINPVTEKRFGPVNGRKCHDYFHGVPDVCSWCKSQEVFAGRSVKWEWYFPKTGETYEISEAPMYSVDGITSKLEIFHDITERKRTEDTLKDLEKQRRHLSFQLLMAQETERRRISRELHDELGGALAVFKLRLGHIERTLLKEQTELKEECRANLQYVDEVIENVLRLSRDLSPSILEDLGLSAALQWLLNNFGKNYNIRMESDITDMDHLFPQNNQIIVYRIVQEALTNIGKHSQAKNISLAVKREDGMIFFTVEDDGKGFDMRKSVILDASRGGLGLASMDERAKMLGGSLDVWSEEGKGTRITVRIPMEKRGSF